jgi:signal transduction histidine kinase
MGRKRKDKDKERERINMKKMMHEEGQTAGDLIRDYIADRKPAIIMFFSTSLIFVLICSLYQLHNIEKLLYAFFIALFFWLCYGCYDATRYLQKRKKISLAGKNPKQAVDVLLEGRLGDSSSGKKFAPDRGMGHLTQMEEAYTSLIEDLCQLHNSLESEERIRRGEMTDYYMMWAHQIKTPIAAMKLLLSDREDGFMLMQELFKIEQYVEMVLQYLRMESMASDMILKEYDLLTLVKQSVKKYSVLFIHSGLKLQLRDFDVKILTDEKWLSFVLEQIISNSIKYTRKGKVSIYIKPDTQKTLVVEDTGIGIRQEDIPRIFERGFTGYNGHMDKKSTGIGLYLCKQIMDRLSHGIAVSSREGKGTKIYLDLSRDSDSQNANERTM